MKNKNDVFSLVLVLLVVFLAILWSRERTYHARLNRVKGEMVRLEADVRLLRLQAEALQSEVEMQDLSTYLRLIKNLEGKKARHGSSRKLE